MEDTQQMPQPQSQPQSQQYFAMTLNQVISKMASDMNFLGIVIIIMGAINCLTIIAAPIGVPIIFAGIRLRESCEFFRNYMMNNDQLTLQQALEKLSRFFFIYKVLTIIYLAFMALYIVVILIIILVGGFSFLNSANFN